ncbi:MAG: hypothetical protein IPJ85_01915 [Flavobacteriales bacterium]|nr:hypothetical protein [Flavobacteriales bacterium]
MTRSILLGLALTALSLALHFAPIWVTMLNRGAMAWDGQPIGQDYIAQIIDDHRSGSDISFRRRPLTTWCINSMTATGMPPKSAFMLWSFGLFFLCGLLIRRIAQLLGSSHAQATIAQAIFHLSPTVLFAWFEPMYTYDEPLQYAAFLIAFAAAWQGRVVLSSIAMALSLIAHETSIFLLPSFAMIPGLSRNSRWALLITPLLLFALFLVSFLPAAGLADHAANDAYTRLGTLAFNFGTWTMAGETIGYALLVLLLPCTLLWCYMRGAAPDERKLLRAFMIALVLNALAVLVAAKAREARVFALPLLLAWPLLGKAIVQWIEAYGGWNRLFAAMRKPLVFAALVAATTLMYLITRYAFVLSTNVAGDNPWHEFLAVQIVVAVLISWRAHSELFPAKHEIPA